MRELESQVSRTAFLTKTLVSLLAIAVVVISGCGGKQPTEQPPGPGQSIRTLKGVSLSPKSFQADDFADFFQKAKQTGEIVTWAGDWNELANTQSGGPIVVASLAPQYGYIPVIEVQFFTQSSGTLLRPLDNATRQAYKSTAAAFAGRHKPKYLAFGIEVNVLYEKSPADFASFVQLYSEVHDAVKVASPDTRVFTIFQLEKMKGLNGGLFGGANDPAKGQWSLLDRFPKADLIAFTTYPSLVYQSPSAIPTDYYAEIKARTTKPVAFTEIGWHSEASPKGWEGSETEQAEFIPAFFNLTKDLSKELVVWSFIYDQNTSEPFRSMGLRRRGDGTAKPAWDEWLKAR